MHILCGMDWYGHPSHNRNPKHEHTYISLLKTNDHHPINHHCCKTHFLHLCTPCLVVNIPSTLTLGKSTSSSCYKSFHIISISCSYDADHSWDFPYLLDLFHVSKTSLGARPSCQDHSHPHHLQRSAALHDCRDPSNPLA